MLAAIYINANFLGHRDMHFSAKELTGVRSNCRERTWCLSINLSKSYTFLHQKSVKVILITSFSLEYILRLF
jgi:hypothetical protein